MIFCNNKDYKEQIRTNYKELEGYKNSYNNKISLYNTYLNTMQVFEDGVIERNKLNKEELKNKIKTFQNQINQIDTNLELLNYLLKSIDTIGEINIDKRILNKYNQEYIEIRNNYINNSVGEEQITTNYTNGLMDGVAKTFEKIKEKHEIEMKKILNEKENTQLTEQKDIKFMQENQTINYAEENITKNSQLKNNDTLLISEKLGKVILPYRAEEILEIFNSENSKYVSYEEVIKDKFTRRFSEFKIQFASRYNETMKLARERENYNMADAILLSAEMMKKRYLHPAIIAACKNLNELDVYLDCLDKNEIEEFRIFKIKYELYPMLVKKNKWEKGTRYKEDSKLNISGNIKNIFKSNNDNKSLSIR